MPRLTYYEMGSYNMACDECGRGFKAGELQKRWDGAYACSACWEPRQPQDFVRGVKDNPSVPVARPRTGLPEVGAMWINNGSAVVFWSNNVGTLIPWTVN